MCTLQNDYVCLLSSCYKLFSNVVLVNVFEANFLANFICRRLSMFKYDKYITNSLIITKYINKTYQHKNKCLLLTARFPKGS
jgi:hypothetical protein